MTAPDSEADQVWSYRGYRLDSGHFATAMVHLYRAEVARANLWRSRLDATTNWAVITTGAALTFSFSSPGNPHFVLLLVLLLVLTFLLIEARRYSYYELWYHRVRLLETGFFAGMVAPPYGPASGWGRALAETLREPAFITSRWRAAAVRYRRNYVWLVSLVVISWLLKLSVHPSAATTAREVIARASIGAWVTGPWVMGIVAGIYAALLILATVMHLLPAPFDGHPGAFGGLVEGHERAEETQLAIIITNRRDEVSALLLHELERGVTSLNGTGMYTGESHSVLLCALTAAQEPQLRAIVEQTDPNAFVILTGARDIRGRGFAVGEPPS